MQKVRQESIHVSIFLPFSNCTKISHLQGPTQRSKLDFSNQNRTFSNPIALDASNNDNGSTSTMTEILISRKNQENIRSNSRLTLPDLNKPMASGGTSLKNEFIKSNALFSQIYADLKTNIKKTIDGKPGKLTINDKVFLSSACSL
jgi:hypothetical protein